MTLTITPEAARLMLSEGEAWVPADAVPEVACGMCAGTGQGSTPEPSDCGFCQNGTVSIVGQRVEVCVPGLDRTASERWMRDNIYDGPRIVALALVSEALPILAECVDFPAHVCQCWGGSNLTHHTALPNPRPGPSETDISAWLPHGDWSPTSPCRNCGPVTWKGRSFHSDTSIYTVPRNCPACNGTGTRQRYALHLTDVEDT